MTAPFYADDLITLHNRDCRDVLPTLAPGSVDVLLTDPPYFQVKDEEWDRQWRKAEEFLSWLGEILDLCKPLLKPSATVWCFASPELADEVKRLVGERWRVLNSIRWVKDAGWHKKAEVEALRRFLTPWEGVILAEQFGADGSALQGSGWLDACTRLHAGVFEPIRAYLNACRERAGLGVQDVNAAWQAFRQSKGQMPGHWFSRSQWEMPTSGHYAWLRSTFGADVFGREYEDLRREYEDLRREYEDLRRPFHLSDRGPVTDLWTFPPVMPYPGKHPCEKPPSMLRHMLTTSTRPGAVVLDPFAGSCSTLRVCKELGLHGIGMETERRYCRHAALRLSQDVMSFDETA